MKQLHPKAVWLFFIPSAIIPLLFLLILGISFGAILSNGLKTGAHSNAMIMTIISILVVFVFGFLLPYFWAKLTYRFYKYELVEQGFRKESGVIIKSYVTIPYDRIQNVDIQRGILARMLGLSDLKIQTAGSSIAGAEGRLPGLLHKDAEKLRDELIVRAKGNKNQGL